MTFVNWAHPEDPLIIRKGGSGLGNAEEDNMFEWLSKEGSLQRCKALESLLHNFLILPFCATISLIPPSRSPLSMVKSQDIFVNMLSDSAALDYELMWDSSQCFIQLPLLSLVNSLEIPVNVLSNSHSSHWSFPWRFQSIFYSCFSTHCQWRHKACGADIQ